MITEANTFQLTRKDLYSSKAVAFPPPVIVQNKAILTNGAAAAVAAATATTTSVPRKDPATTGACTALTDWLGEVTDTAHQLQHVVGRLRSVVKYQENPHVGK
eukprot:INCI4855.1.p2 GENE.INCI4855.1~~INCI4855.1.p2  ORF type:complete len:103 (-),score=21.53 INCI4855.1:317-625(-)